jgi:ABC-2 type transport system permease protein
METKNLKDSVRDTAGRHASRHGAFSAGVTALVVAAVLVFNLILAQVPQDYTQFDMTETGIYNITDTSRTYMENLQEDVEIHVLADKEAMDSRIVRFLSKYEELSDRLSVEYVNPTVYPSVLSQYGVDTDTIVVTCAATGRQETVSIDDIIGFDVMQYYYYNNYVETDFDAEGLLTSAVDGVLTDNSWLVYQTSGHNETSLPSRIEELFSKLHMSVESVNLLTDGGIPDDCTMLIINEPVRDLANDELDMILTYLSQGGRVIFNLPGQLDPMPNFETLLSTYGMSLADGMIADTSRYYQNNPYLFFPMVDNSVDAAAGFSEDATVLFFASRGFTLTDPARDSITVKSFLTTSTDGYSIVDDANSSQGTYAVAAVATEEIDDSITARLTVFGADSLIDSEITGSFANIDNVNLFMSAATAGMEGLTNINIEAVSLTTPTNTISTGGIWALLFIFAIPGALLIFGFVRWMRRRKL